MKKGKKGNYFKFISVSMAVLLVMLSFPSIASAAQPPVKLGTTESYAVLAGQTITNIGTTVINGDAGGNVGLYPGSAFTGKETATISGAVNINNPEAITAKNDLVEAYNDAAARTPVTRIPKELGGKTLTPGTYDSAGGFKITGTLTLDAQGDPNGVFVFKTATTLITASASNVKMINGARYCRTFWQVGSSATLGTGSHFVGHILAMTSIAAKTGASVQGQLLARNGAVTLENNTITNGLCAAVTTTPTPKPTPKPSSNTANGGTINGGTLPKTSTPLYTVLFIGVALILAGAVSWRSKKSYE